jgi:hypothetical protein
MSIYQDWSQEELKTFVGLLMLDLRGSWYENDEARIESLEDALHYISFEDVDEDQSVLDLIDLCEDCLKEIIPAGDYDGRIFRGEFLYGYCSQEGLTSKVKKELEVIMNYPEYNLPE